MVEQNILKARTVEGLRAPGFYSDGSGLYFQVAQGGSRSWIYRYKVDGKQRNMGLGSYTHVSLAEARIAAQEARTLRSKGVDPLDAKRRAEPAKTPPKGKAIADGDAGEQTFQWCCDRYVENLAPTLVNRKHIDQWGRTLRTYAGPVIGHLHVKDVTRAHVLEIITPIWTTKHEQALKVRNRIERVLEYAIAKDYRPDPNPANWPRLKPALPVRKGQRHTHHGHLPYKEAPAFMPRLREIGGAPALAFRLLVLTCVRTRELLWAQAAEFDLDAALWTIPEHRMKVREKGDHRVPLSPQAVSVVREAMGLRSGETPYLFEGRKKGKPFSDMLFLMMLRRLEVQGVTGHGFRSTFRTWAADETDYPRDVCERALAHETGNAVEMSYKRTDLLERRRPLMIDWANFIEPV